MTKTFLIRELAENWTDLREMEKLQAKLQRHVTETVSAEDAPLLLLQSTHSTRQNSRTNSVQNTKSNSKSNSTRQSTLVTPVRQTGENHFMRQPTISEHESPLDLGKLMQGVTKYRNALRTTDPDRVVSEDSASQSYSEASHPSTKNTAGVRFDASEIAVFQAERDTNVYSGRGPTTQKQNIADVPVTQPRMTSRVTAVTAIGLAPTKTAPATSYNQLYGNRQVHQPIKQQPPATPAASASTISTSERSSEVVHYKSSEPRQFTGKQYDDVEMFIRNMERYLTRAKITNEEEKVDQLHKHISPEVRITLNKTLTWEESCDYEHQIEFLRKWWPRPKDIEPLRDEFYRMKFNPNNETIEEYARRIQMQRAAGWPDESKVSRSGMLSDFDKGVVEGLIRGLPRGLRTNIEASVFMDTFGLGKNTVDDLLKYTKIQMRSMEQRARSFCKKCGKDQGHSTEECTKGKKVNALHHVYEDEDCYSSPSEDMEPKPLAIYSSEDYAVNALQTPDQTARPPFAQQTTAQRQPFRKPFPGNNNLRPGNPQNQFRQRYPGPAQKRPPNPEVKKFVICYSCGEEGHYQNECTAENVKKNDGPLTPQEMKEMLQHFHQIKRFLWRGVTNASTSEVKEITAECEKIDSKILAIEAAIEIDEAVLKEQDPLNK